MRVFKILAILIIFVLASCKSDVQNMKSSEEISFLFDDFEEHYCKGENLFYSEIEAFSGNIKACLLTKNSFSGSQKVKGKYLNKNDLKEIYYSAYILALQPEINMVFVMDVKNPEKKEKSYYKTIRYKLKNIEAEKWMRIEGKFNTNDYKYNEDDIMSFYFWNKDSLPFYIDDLEILFDTKSNVLKQRFYYNLENVTDYKHKLTDEIAYSDSLSSFAKGKFDCSVSTSTSISEIANIDSINSVSVNTWIYTKKPQVNALLVFEITDNNKQILWQAYPIDNKEVEVNKWSRVHAEFAFLGNEMKSEYKFHAYLLNLNSNEIFVDDFYIKFSNKKSNSSFSSIDLTVGNYNDQKRTNFPPFKKLNFVQNNINTEVLENLDWNLISPPSFISGNFLGNNNMQILIQNHNSYLFEYVAEENKFDSIPIKNNELFKENIQLFKVNDGSKQERVVIYNSKNNELYISVLSSNLSDMSFVHLYDFENIPLSISEIKCNSQNKLIVFYNDATAEIFSFNRKEIIATHIDVPKEVKYIFSNPKASVKLCSGNFINDNNPELLVISSENNKHKYMLLEYNVLNNELIPLFLPHNNYCGIQFGVDTLKTNNQLIKVDYNNDGIDELLKYDCSWRNDFKLISFSEIGFQTIYKVDFKGYNNANPKYYEKIRMLPLQFDDTTPFSVLLHFENSSVEVNSKISKDLPAQTLVYTLLNN